MTASADTHTPGSSTTITPRESIFNLNLREFWRHRELLYFFVWRDLKVRYKQTIIGAAWAIIQPLATMVLFTIFFGQLLGLPSAGLPDPVFYYSTLLPWGYFSTAMSSATQTMIENQGVIRKIYFPRLILPVSSVIPGLVDFVIALSVLVVLMIYYGITPSWGILLLPAFMLLAIATALGAGLWLSVLNATYRDIRYAVPFIIQMWFFVSPIIYPADQIPSALQPLYGINPMAGVIEGFRWAVTGQGDPPGAMIFVSAAMVAVLLAGGLVFFRRKEVLIADVI